MPSKYCSFPGCANLIEHGSYCDEHKMSRKHAKAKTIKKSAYHHENKSFYHSKEWQSMSAYVYERDGGRCQSCGKYVYGRNAHRHHIIPVKVNPQLKLDPDNIILLCSKCHVKIENEKKFKPAYPKYFSSPPTQK